MDRCQMLQLFDRKVPTLVHLSKNPGSFVYGQTAMQTQNTFAFVTFMNTLTQSCEL